MSILSSILGKEQNKGEAGMQQERSELYKNVEKVINEDIRPFIEADGGRIVLKDVKDDIVFVQLAGACAGCPGATMTLKGGVENILKQRIGEVREVQLVR